MGVRGDSYVLREDNGAPGGNRTPYLAVRSPEDTVLGRPVASGDILS